MPLFGEPLFELFLACARALLVIPRAQAERCFRLIHGVGVEDMTESEQKEAFALC